MFIIKDADSPQSPTSSLIRKYIRQAPRLYRYKKDHSGKLLCQTHHNPTRNNLEKINKIKAVASWGLSGLTDGLREAAGAQAVRPRAPHSGIAQHSADSAFPWVKMTQRFKWVVSVAAGST